MMRAVSNPPSPPSVLHNGPSHPPPEALPAASSPLAKAPVELRPLALGEIVDRTATFWRQHVGALFRLFLGYQLCVYAFSKGFALLASRYFPLFGRGGVQLVSSLDPAELREQVLSGLGAVLILVFGLWWMSWQVGVAGTHFAVSRMTGTPAPLEACLGRMWRKAGATTGVYFVSLLWAVGACVLCMLPGVGVMVLGLLASADGPLRLVLVIVGLCLCGLGYLVALLWYALRFMLVSQVLAMEEVDAFGAFRRSGALMRGTLGEGLLGRVALRATLLYTAVMLLLFSINLVAATPSMIIQSVYGHIFEGARANPDAVPQLLLIPVELLQVGLQAVFAPLAVLCAAVFYVDMRVRREGFDLEL